MPGLIQGDTPMYGEPELSWPIYGVVGNIAGSNSGRELVFDNEIDLRREDDEIILILSAVIKEL
jgi:hypothetical protein